MQQQQLFDWWLPSEWRESCCVWACGRLSTSQTLLSLSIPAILELQWRLEPVSLVTWSKSFMLGNLFAKFSFGGKLYKCWSGMEEAIFGFTLPCLTFCSWVGMVKYADRHWARVHTFLWLPRGGDGETNIESESGEEPCWLFSHLPQISYIHGHTSLEISVEILRECIFCLLLLGCVSQIAFHWALSSHLSSSSSVMFKL